MQKMIPETDVCVCHVFHRHDTNIIQRNIIGENFCMTTDTYPPQCKIPGQIVKLEDE